jgi:hypothetical protein
VELGERGFLGHIRFVKQKSPPTKRSQNEGNLAAP